MSDDRDRVLVIEGLLDEMMAESASSSDRRMTAVRAVQEGYGSALASCDRCGVTRDMVGMSRHLNISETDYAAARHPGSALRLHAREDLRVATDSERVGFDAVRQPWRTI